MLETIGESPNRLDALNSNLLDIAAPYIDPSLAAGRLRLAVVRGLTGAMGGYADGRGQARRPPDLHARLADRPGGDVAFVLAVEVDPARPRHFLTDPGIGYRFHG